MSIHAFIQSTFCNPSSEMVTPCLSEIFSNRTKSIRQPNIILQSGFVWLSDAFHYFSNLTEKGQKHPNFPLGDNKRSHSRRIPLTKSLSKSKVNVSSRRNLIGMFGITFTTYRPNSNYFYFVYLSFSSPTFMFCRNSWLLLCEI